MRSQYMRGDWLPAGRTNLVSFVDDSNSADSELAIDPRPLRILAVLGNNEPSYRAIKWLVALGNTVPALEVVLIHSCPLPHWESSQLRAGGQASLPRLGQQFQDMANRKLTVAGINCRLESGDPLQAIADCCKSATRDVIVIAEDKPGMIDRFILRRLGLARLSPTLHAIQELGIPICIVR